jgi:hypothetical protein
MIPIKSLSCHWLLARRAFYALTAILIVFFAQQARCQVTTSQYDNARTGANLAETLLTPKNVNANQFGKLFTLRVDGDIYAQPLYLPRLEIPGKGTHNVVFVATEHDSVYAFDAETYSTEPLWQMSFINPDKGVTTVPAHDLHCPFIRPEVGITSTPVIDQKTGTLYVIARTKEGAPNPQYVQRLHALDVSTGAEKFGGPVIIHASAKGQGDGSHQGEVAFDSLRENQRAPLLLTNGIVYITWASSCDVGPYHGWIMTYDAHTLAQTAVLNTSPDAGESGIWQGDAAPAADGDGNVYVATGNGKFDANAGGRDYGDSVLKLAIGKDGLAVRDYFTPFNQLQLDAEDDDLGSSGPVLLPEQPGVHPHLLIISGKGAGIYVIDRDRMGKYHGGSDNEIVEMLPTGGGAFGAPAYWNQHLYYSLSDDVIKDFKVEHGLLSRQPISQGKTKFTDPGATPTVSSSGTKDGVVWVVETRDWRASDRPAVLHAYEASDVSHEIYNSEQNSSRDRAGTALRFVIPTVASGRVYVGTKGELEVFGLHSAR